MKLTDFLAHDEDENITHEKYMFMRAASVTNTSGTFVAPILLYFLIDAEAPQFNLFLWLGIMSFAVLLRAYLLFSKRIQEKSSDKTKIFYLNVGIFFTTLSWGLGWYILGPVISIEHRCLYLLMTSTALFVGIYAYSINKSTLLVFFLPMKVLEFSATLAPPFLLPWPTVIGEILFFYYLIKMSSHFSNSWLTSLILRKNNERLNEDLKTETQTAISANVAKSKFIATASHDLRQPLQSLNIYLDLLETEKSKLSGNPAISQIKKSVISLNTMFKSLLDISKLDSNISNLHQENFQLSMLINALSGVYKPLANSKKLDLKFNYSQQLICGDFVLLQTLVGNLIANAIQYTNIGVVTVIFTNHEDKLVIEVHDTGCGIKKNEIDKIFLEFYRVNETRNFHDGLGLGLSIVARICKIINATISVESELGNWTSFKIKTNFLSRQSIENNISELNSQTSSTEIKSNMNHLNVVIFEDDDNIAQAYAENFMTRGFKVFHLSEDIELLQSELLKIDKIDCILSDYRLKKTTGDQLIQFLRESFNEEIPALIVTADTSPSHLKLFENFNIKVLHKPIEMQDILLNIEKLI